MTFLEKQFFFFLLVFIGSAGFGFSQDTLWLSNGKKEIGKVLLINKGEVNFRKQALPNGPDFIYAKGKVTRIKFSNGHLELMEVEPTDEDFVLPGEESSKTNAIFTIKRNSLWFNTVDLNVFRIGFTYEHSFGKKNQFSFRIPFSASMRDEKVYFMADQIRFSENSLIPGSYVPILKPIFDDYSTEIFAPIYSFSQLTVYNNFGNSFYTGLGFRNYPKGLKDKNFYYGILVDFGTFVYKKNIYTYHPDNDGYTSYNDFQYSSTGKIGGMVRILAELGGRYNPTPHFSMSLGASMGYTMLLTDTKKLANGFMGISINPSFCLGYNFGQSKEKE
ncbi:MAG: hypothetical protein K1X82_01380 [Bacteroidia bacterium]|nr:hypothetical protein [Bacteroidia bacterium]